MHILRLPLFLAVLATALTLSASTASAGFRPGGPTPGVCAGAAFTDVLGTSGADDLRGGSRPERIYGFKGDDEMRGSGLRATCLFGGQGADILALGPAGGIALGEEGGDLLLGTEKDDGLSGGPGADTMYGGPRRDALRGDTGIDGFFGGPGGDIIAADDGRREVVACGGGDDVAEADRTDVLFGCERVRLQGKKRLPTRRVTPSTARSRSTLRLEFRAPSSGGAGTYAVLAARCKQSDPVAVTVLPAPGRRVRAGQRIRVGLRAPRGGWCQGKREAALVRRPRCASTCLIPPPYEPLARITFRVVK